MYYVHAHTIYEEATINNQPATDKDVLVQSVVQERVRLTSYDDIFQEN